MQIRVDQLRAFSDAATADFQGRMTAHLRRFFPETCRGLGEEALQERIRYGISAARSYDIVKECDVCKYIDVMFAIGWQFDQDPQHSWAREILTDASVEDIAVKIECLCDAVESYVVSQALKER